MVVGDVTTAVDVIVLGAGPGGYVAAIRAAQLGKQVAIVDPGPPGGTCLNLGCIPSKALLAAADRAWQNPALATMGISFGEVKIDFRKLSAWKDSVVQRLSSGVRQLLEGRKVQIVTGKGWFESDHEVRVEGEYGSSRFSFDHCILAVGADPKPLPGLAFDGQHVLTPGQALQLTELTHLGDAVGASAERTPSSLPDCEAVDAAASLASCLGSAERVSIPSRPSPIYRLAIAGSDYIAAELATLFAKLGVPVRLLIPPEQRLLNEFDPAAGRQVQAQLKKLGVEVETNVVDIAAVMGDASKLIVSAGLTPHTDNLNLSKAGVEADERGFILVDNRMRTSNPAIYAVGDVTGGRPLATAAIKQGKVAAENIAGMAAQYAPQAIPQVACTDPEVAAVGLTASEAEAAGYEVVTGRFPLAANGRALTLGAAEGAVLTVAEKDSGLLLGITIIGVRAGELIGEAALAIEMGTTLTDLVETLHPHPGLAETLQESVEAALGITVHLLRTSS
jgi:dihydrolipoamide dehydrogenase